MPFMVVTGSLLPSHTFLYFCFSVSAFFTPFKFPILPKILSMSLKFLSTTRIGLLSPVLKHDAFNTVFILVFDESVKKEVVFFRLCLH